MSDLSDRAFFDTCYFLITFRIILHYCIETTNIEFFHPSLLFLKLLLHASILLCHSAIAPSFLLDISFSITRRSSQSKSVLFSKNVLAAFRNLLLCLYSFSNRRPFNSSLFTIFSFSNYFRLSFTLTLLIQNLCLAQSFPEDKLIISLTDLMFQQVFGLLKEVIHIYVSEPMT
jgi:hypothetical protein